MIPDLGMLALADYANARMGILLKAAEVVFAATVSLVLCRFLKRDMRYSSTWCPINSADERVY